MFKRKLLSQAFGIATLAMMFSAAPVYSQSGSASEAKSPTPAGQTPPTNQAGKMNPGGPNSASRTSGSSGTSSASSAGASLSKSDQKTMRDMAQANLAEIEMGKIALKQTKDDKVRDFAQKMIDDHTKAQDQLQQLAQAKGMTLPTEPDSKHQAMAKKLSSLSGDAFDRQYMSKDGVQDHKKVHRMLQRAESKAKDPDLKALVTQTDPIIEQHLQMAEDVTGKTTSTGASGTRGSSASGASGNGK